MNLQNLSVVQPLFLGLDLYAIGAKEGEIKDWFSHLYSSLTGPLWFFSAPLDTGAPL